MNIPCSKKEEIIHAYDVYVDKKYFISLKLKKYSEYMFSYGYIAIQGWINIIPNLPKIWKSISIFDVPANKFICGRTKND